ncbi:unnamed protein product [Amoebophrya sp. A120]|nr:unnamed protein product [Amoebophrya sp. A120]|eukprot:GSA120T00024156001.1
MCRTHNKKPDDDDDDRVRMLATIPAKSQPNFPPLREEARGGPRRKSKRKSSGSGDTKRPREENYKRLAASTTSRAARTSPQQERARVKSYREQELCSDHDRNYVSTGGPAPAARTAEKKTTASSSRVHVETKTSASSSRNRSDDFASRHDTTSGCTREGLSRTFSTRTTTTQSIKTTKRWQDDLLAPPVQDELRRRTRANAGTGRGVLEGSSKTTTSTTGPSAAGKLLPRSCTSTATDDPKKSKPKRDVEKRRQQSKNTSVSSTSSSSSSSSSTSSSSSVVEKTARRKSKTCSENYNKYKLPSSRRSADGRRQEDKNTTRSKTSKRNKKRKSYTTDDDCRRWPDTCRSSPVDDYFPLQNNSSTSRARKSNVHRSKTREAAAKKSSKNYRIDDSCISVNKRDEDALQRQKRRQKRTVAPPRISSRSSSSTTSDSSDEQSSTPRRNYPPRRKKGTSSSHSKSARRRTASGGTAAQQECRDAVLGVDENKRITTTTTTSGSTARGMSKTLHHSKMKNSRKKYDQYNAKNCGRTADERTGSTAPAQLQDERPVVARESLPEERLPSPSAANRNSAPAEVVRPPKILVGKGPSAASSSSFPEIESDSLKKSNSTTASEAEKKSSIEQREAQPRSTRTTATTSRSTSSRDCVASDVKHAGGSSRTRSSDLHSDSGEDDDSSTTSTSEEEADPENRIHDLYWAVYSQGCVRDLLPVPRQTTRARTTCCARTHLLEYHKACSLVGLRRRREFRRTSGACSDGDDEERPLPLKPIADLKRTSDCRFATAALRSSCVTAVKTDRLGRVHLYRENNDAFLLARVRQFLQLHRKAVLADPSGGDYIDHDRPANKKRPELELGRKWTRILPDGGYMPDCWRDFDALHRSRDRCLQLARRPSRQQRDAREDFAQIIEKVELGEELCEPDRRRYLLWYFGTQKQLRLSGRSKEAEKAALELLPPIPAGGGAISLEEWAASVWQEEAERKQKELERETDFDWLDERNREAEVEKFEEFKTWLEGLDHQRAVQLAEEERMREEAERQRMAEEDQLSRAYRTWLKSPSGQGLSVTAAPFAPDVHEEVFIRLGGMQAAASGVMTRNPVTGNNLFVTDPAVALLRDDPSEMKQGAVAEVAARVGWGSCSTTSTSQDDESYCANTTFSQLSKDSQRQLIRQRATAPRTWKRRGPLISCSELQTIRENEPESHGVPGVVQPKRNVKTNAKTEKRSVSSSLSSSRISASPSSSSAASTLTNTETDTQRLCPPRPALEDAEDARRDVQRRRNLVRNPVWKKLRRLVHPQLLQAVRRRRGADCNDESVTEATGAASDILSDLPPEPSSVLVEESLFLEDQEELSRTVLLLEDEEMCGSSEGATKAYHLNHHHREKPRTSSRSSGRTPTSSTGATATTGIPTASNNTNTRSCSFSNPDTRSRSSNPRSRSSNSSNNPVQPQHEDRTQDAPPNPSRSTQHDRGQQVERVASDRASTIRTVNSESNFATGAGTSSERESLTGTSRSATFASTSPAARSQAAGGRSTYTASPVRL